MFSCWCTTNPPPPTRSSLTIWQTFSTAAKADGRSNCLSDEAPLSNKSICFYEDKTARITSGVFMYYSRIFLSRKEEEEEASLLVSFKDEAKLFEFMSPR